MAQLSKVMGVPREPMVAVQRLGSIPVVRFAGAWMVGAKVSVTVTNWESMAVFPEKSVAVHRTIVEPTAKKPGASFSVVTAEQSSLATAEPRFKLLVPHWVLSA